MKKIYLLFFAFLSFPAFSQQSFTSADNTTAAWTDMNWTKSFGWMQNRPAWDNASVPPGHGYWHEAHIYGYVTRNGNLSVNNGAHLHVYDTLRITGDFTSQQNVTVHSGGVLIVEGNMVTNGGGFNNIGGTMVVLGNLTNSNGGDVNISGEFYLVGALSSPGSGERYNGSATPPADYFKDNDDLLANAPLYSFAYGGTLPVEFAGAELRELDESVMVLWSTASEENNDYFTVERSKDGKHFTSIGSLKGQENSNSLRYYEFADRQPAEGVSYYRIRQTDLDGTYSFSTILRYENTKTSAVAISFYPNPAVDRIYLKSSGQETMNVRLIDMSGTVRQSATLENKGIDDPFVDTASMDRGYYILEVTTGTSRSIRKILLN